MDPNQTQNLNPTPTSVPPVNVPPVPQAVPTPQKSNKGLVLAFIVIILLIVGAISIFLFTNKKSTPPQSQIVPTPVAAAVSPTQIPSPSPEITQSPEQALQQVTIDNPNADIQNISADAQQL